MFRKGEGRYVTLVTPLGVVSFYASKIVKASAGRLVWKDEDGSKAMWSGDYLISASGDRKIDRGLRDLPKKVLEPLS